MFNLICIVTTRINNIDRCVNSLSKQLLHGISNLWGFFSSPLRLTWMSFSEIFIRRLSHSTRPATALTIRHCGEARSFYNSISVSVATRAGMYLRDDHTPPCVVFTSGVFVWEILTTCTGAASAGKSQGPSYGKTLEPRRNFFLVYMMV